MDPGDPFDEDDLPPPLQEDEALAEEVATLWQQLNAVMRVMQQQQPCLPVPPAPAVHEPLEGDIGVQLCVTNFHCAPHQEQEGQFSGVPVVALACHKALTDPTDSARIHRNATKGTSMKFLVLKNVEKMSIW